MKNAGYGVAILGVILVLFSVVNKFLIRPEIKFAFLDHTNRYIGGAGAVVAIIGLILIFMASRAAVASQAS